jgi:N-terminal ig-like domain of cellulase.
VSLRKGLIAFVLAAVTAMAADQVLPTPYDLIRPVWPLTWDSTIFNTNFTAGPKRNSLPDINTPAAYSPNNIIPDSLNQAFIDAMLIQMSPIRVNQAGYRPQDPQKYVLYVGSATDFEVVDQMAMLLEMGVFSETSFEFRVFFLDK